MVRDEVIEHTAADCDREIRSDSRFDPFHCRPDWFKCSCGQQWVHICDEAEGCFYMRSHDYREALRLAR